VNAPKCALDLDDSGVVNTGDLLQILAQWGAGTCARADADGNGAVDTSDLLQLLSAWGSCAP